MPWCSNVCLFGQLITVHKFCLLAVHIVNSYSYIINKCTCICMYYVFDLLEIKLKKKKKKKKKFCLSVRLQLYLDGIWLFVYSTYSWYAMGAWVNLKHCSGK